MRKLRVLPAVAFGILTLGGAAGGSHTASAAPADPVDVDVPEPADQNNGDLPEPPEAEDVETPGGVDPNESGVTETADLPEADEPTDPEVVDPADAEVADPADTEVDDPADPEVADPADAEVPDPVAVDDDDDDERDTFPLYGDDVVREGRAPSSGGATAVARSGSLPHTGSEPSSTAIIGAFVMMIGGVMHRVSSRRETVVR